MTMMMQIMPIDADSDFDSDDVHDNVDDERVSCVANMVCKQNTSDK